MRDGTDDFLERRIRKALNETDARDLLTAPLVAVNYADDQISPPELGFLEKGIKRVRRAKVMGLRITEETRGHGSHAHAALWEGQLQKC